MNLSKIESYSCRAGADAREAAGPAVHKSPAALLRKAERDRIADEARRRSAAVDRKYWQGVKKLSDFFLSP